MTGNLLPYDLLCSVCLLCTSTGRVDRYSNGHLRLDHLIPYHGGRTCRRWHNTCTYTRYQRVIYPACTPPSLASADETMAYVAFLTYAPRLVSLSSDNSSRRLAASSSYDCSVKLLLCLAPDVCKGRVQIETRSHMTSCEHMGKVTIPPNHPWQMLKAVSHMCFRRGDASYSQC